MKPGHSTGVVVQQQVQDKCCSSCYYRNLSYQLTGFPSWTFARATVPYILNLKFSIIWNVFAAISWALRINSRWLRGLRIRFWHKSAPQRFSSFVPLWWCLFCYGIFGTIPHTPTWKEEKSFALTIMDSSESCYQKVTWKEREVVLCSNRNSSSVVPSRSPQNRGKFYSDISMENQTFCDQRQLFKIFLTLSPLSLESDDVAQNLLCPVE